MIVSRREHVRAWKGFPFCKVALPEKNVAKKSRETPKSVAFRSALSSTVTNPVLQINTSRAVHDWIEAPLFSQFPVARFRVWESKHTFRIQIWLQKNPPACFYTALYYSMTFIWRRLEISSRQILRKSENVLLGRPGNCTHITSKTIHLQHLYAIISRHFCKENR